MLLKLFPALLLFVSSTVGANNSYKGYLLDSEGNIVVTHFGECVKSGQWSSSASQPTCDESLKNDAVIDYEMRSIIEHSKSRPENILGILQQVINDLKHKQEIEEKDVVKENANNLFCDQDYTPENSDGLHQYRIAVALLSGACKPVDDLKTEGKMLLKESIGYGRASAMNVYGYLLIDGALLGYQDTEYGIEYFKRAAEYNDLDALYNLGFVYQYGVGVDGNKVMSNDYFAKSGGVANSLFRLKRHDSNVEAHMDHVEDLVESGKVRNNDNVEDLGGEDNVYHSKSDAIVKPEGGSMMPNDHFVFPYIKN